MSKNFVVRIDDTLFKLLYLHKQVNEFYCYRVPMTSSIKEMWEFKIKREQIRQGMVGFVRFDRENRLYYTTPNRGSSTEPLQSYGTRDVIRFYPFFKIKSNPRFMLIAGRGNSKKLSEEFIVHYILKGFGKNTKGVVTEIVYIAVVERK